MATQARTQHGAARLRAGRVSAPRAVLLVAVLGRAREAARRRLPPLTETTARLAPLSSANTDEPARRHADMTLEVPLAGVGLLEFHHMDAARDAGRRAAEAALGEAPDWLLGGAPAPGPASARTVVRL